MLRTALLTALGVLLGLAILLYLLWVVPLFMGPAPKHPGVLEPKPPRAKWK
jgi:hypothetical protein